MQFIAFDIETTGFIPRVDQIVEIACVKFENGKEVQSFSSLVDPQTQIPPGAMAVHGITDEMVRGQPKIETVLAQVAEFCGDLPLVAHNAPFDTEFVKADIQKFESAAPRGLILDSCAMARKVIPGAPNYKLGTLVQHLGIRIDGDFHRAEADARFCGRLFAIMIERIFAGGAPVVLENLVNLSSGQPLKFPQVQRSHKQLDLFAGL